MVRHASACGSAGAAADERAMASGAAARLRHRRLVLLGVPTTLGEFLGRLPVGTDPGRELAAGGGQAVRRSVPDAAQEGHVRAGADQRGHRVDVAAKATAWCGSIVQRRQTAGHSPAVGHAGAHTGLSRARPT
jgi:hypothetical protein